MSIPKDWHVTDSPAPRKFSIFIGGFFGPSFSVKKVNDSLIYHIAHPGESMHREESFSSTPAEWELFGAKLNELDIWNWQSEYLNNGVCDGTQWSVDITWGSKTLTCHGDNNYPGRCGRPANSPEKTVEFAVFLKAVERLIGGRAFH